MQSVIILIHNGIKFFLYSHIFIAMCAISLLLFYADVNHVPVNEISFLILLVFMAVPVAYNVPFLLGSGVIKDSDRLQWNQRYRWYQVSFFSLQLVTVAILFFFLNRNSQFLLLGTGVLSLMYSMPLVRKKKSFITINNIPYFKNFLVSLIWALVVVWLPYMQSEKPWSDFLWPEGTQSFFLILSLVLICDIRDIDKDREIGIKTIATRIGSRTTRLISIVCMLLTAFIPLVVRGVESDITKVWMLTAAVGTAIIVGMKKTDSDASYLFWIDGVIMLPFLFSILLKIIF